MGDSSMNGIHLTMRLAGGTDLSNYSDKIDSRDVIARIDELEAEYADTETGEVLPTGAWDDDAWEERQTLISLLDSIRRCGDYEGHADDGIFLTRESAWTDAVQEWHADTYDAFKRYDPSKFKDVDVSWDDMMSMLPWSCVDWDEVATVCASDTTTLEYDGVTYYVGP